MIERDIIDRAMIEFHPATFRPLVGTPFNLRRPDGSQLELTLTEVALYAPSGEEPVEREGVRTPFSIYFAAGSLVPQGTYPFDHVNLGAFELFVVPIGNAAQGFRYEAVFT